MAKKKACQKNSPERGTRFSQDGKEKTAELNSLVIEEWINTVLKEDTHDDNGKNYVLPNKFKKNLKETFVQKLSIDLGSL